jgi:hypothetical protein
MKLLSRALRYAARKVDGVGPERRVGYEFFDWITYAVAGMTHPGNFYCFDYAIRHLPSQAPILEIGTWCGRSAIALSYLMGVHGRTNQIVTCDDWDYERDRGNPNVGDAALTHEELRMFLKESYLRNARTFCPSRLPHTIERNSDSFFAAWDKGDELPDVFNRPTKLGGTFSFCFIDGNHTYEAALRDFQNCDRFLETGGFVFFDDSGDDTGWEVCKVVREVAQIGRYTLEMKNPNYLFRKQS